MGRACGVSDHQHVLGRSTTPIDFERGGQVVGDKFLAQVEANVEIIERVLTRAGSTPHDWSRRLGSEVFGYGARIHEHLDEPARADLARILVDLLT